jgi:ParB-like nuclease domain
MKATVDTPMNTGVLPQISIEYRPIELPKPDPANPRLHSNKQIRQIASSIKTFGFNVPVLVDYGMELGHARRIGAGHLSVRVRLDQWRQATI